MFANFGIALIRSVDFFGDSLDALLDYALYFGEVVIGRSEFYMADEQIEYQVIPAQGETE